MGRRSKRSGGAKGHTTGQKGKKRGRGAPWANENSGFKTKQCDKGMNSPMDEHLLDGEASGGRRNHGEVICSGMRSWSI